MKQNDTHNSRFKMGLISMAAGSALVIGGLWIVPAHAEGGSDQGSCSSEQPQSLTEGDDSSDCSSSCDNEGDSQLLESSDNSSDGCEDDSSSCDNEGDSQILGEGDDSSDESDDDCADETTTTVVDTTVVDTTVVDTTVVDTTIVDTTVAETTTSVASQGPVPPTSIDQQSEAVLPSTGSSSTSLLVAFGGLLLGLGVVVAAAGRRNAAH